jgi:preprotein translocase subunit SecG
MYQIITFLHVFIAVCIVGLVLVQQGKGATMGAAFGSGASQTVFGSRGSGSFLFRLTMGFALVFFVTSLALNYLVVHDYKQQKAATTLSLPLNTQSQPDDTLLPASPSEIPARQ